MGFQSSRFKFNSSRGQFHSSGMANGDSVTGIGANQTFKQRQQVEKNRQNIARYRDAAVVQAYRKEALGTTKTTDQSQDLTEEARKHRKKHSSQIDVSERPSSRVKRVRTSRIDIVKPSYSARPTHGSAVQTQESVRHAAPASRRMAFCEPSSRKYNPYQ